MDEPRLKKRHTPLQKIVNHEEAHTVFLVCEVIFFSYEFCKISKSTFFTVPTPPPVDDDCFC